MYRNVLHNINNTPFNERETFNNAILLLSMVKSEYYYIVGFSRPDNIIEIGFDFQDKAYGKVTETVTMDFSSNTKKIRVFGQLNNILFEDKTEIPFKHKNNFVIDKNNGLVHYEILFEKDSVIPVSIDKLNQAILSIKKDLIEFIDQSVSYILSKHKY